ncbi:MAG: hypothetical protein QF492_09525, partial [Candidatus Krumholzibacteria bacterium]|nr:hypothetical protein [Candidatus Krumholzibacteria bacterium]
MLVDSGRGHRLGQSIQRGEYQVAAIIDQRLAKAVHELPRRPGGAGLHQEVPRSLSAKRSSPRG